MCVTDYESKLGYLFTEKTRLVHRASQAGESNIAELFYECSFVIRAFIYLSKFRKEKLLTQQKKQKRRTMCSNIT